MTQLGDRDDFNLLLRELDDVKRQLAETDATDFARRATLRERETELREEVRSFSQGWTDHLSIDQLRRRIGVLEQQIEAHYGNRLPHTSGGQTGFGGGLDPRYLHEMNRAMDKSGDIEGKKAELRRLKDQLTRLEDS